MLAWSAGLIYVLYDTALLAYVAWKSWPLRTLPTAAAPRPADERRPTLSVIIAAYNEAPVLRKTIGSLLAQDELIEQIVIADDGSDDETAAVLASEYGLVEAARRRNQRPQPEPADAALAARAARWQGSRAQRRAAADRNRNRADRGRRHPA